MRGHLGTGTFRRREGQLQQISVFASLNLKKHCKLNKCKRIYCKECMSQIRANNN